MAGYYSSSTDLDGLGMAFGMMGIMSFVQLLMIAFSVLCYVFESLGMYTIAKRRGINHPWLAWIPVANLWMLGCIADQYRYVVRGQVKNRRKILLTLEIIMVVLLIVVIGCVFGVLGQAVIGIMEDVSDEALMRSMIGPLLGVLVSYMAMLVLSVVLLVFQYISLYDLYTSCSPDNAVLFLVLGIIFSVTTPFFIFACRNKDLGMPPRRPVQPAPNPYQYQPNYQPPQPPQNPPALQEPWERPDNREE